MLDINGDIYAESHQRGPKRYDVMVHHSTQVPRPEHEVLTSVMAMTEMPQGRHIKGSCKNLLARSSPNKLDCVHIYNLSFLFIL